MYKNNGNKHLKCFKIKKKHASRVGEISTETRGVTSDIIAYSTVHFHNPTLL